jgi:hypothetical protein
MTLQNELVPFHITCLTQMGAARKVQIKDNVVLCYTGMYGWYGGEI